ncbi:hypothetical protein [Malacoplasma penetrans]|nr:hypothetical protein [Malacoplasma penetrans]
MLDLNVSRIGICERKNKLHRSKQTSVYLHKFYCFKKLDRS